MELAGFSCATTEAAIDTSERDVKGIIFLGRSASILKFCVWFVPAFRPTYTREGNPWPPDRQYGVSKQQVARLTRRATRMQQFG
jgi:hypothetical protein